MSDHTTPVSEITIDNCKFQVTHSPFGENSYILWFKDTNASKNFIALGKFAGFDKKKILNFVVKYVTTPEIQEDIESRRFNRKLEVLTLKYFKDIAEMSRANQEQAYRSLFDLDISTGRDSLNKRMRMMAKRFHPDAGGNHQAMTVINEAYKFLNSQ